MSDASAAGDLSERLRSTIDHVAQQPEARRLALALALADGFAFQIAVCNSPRVAAALQLWLEQAVASERGEAVEVERLSPYPLDYLVAGPASLRLSELASIVLEPLLGPAEVNERNERLVIVDAARATARDAEIWRLLLMRINERRNAIGRAVAAPLTLILPPLLDAELARLAPDLWSIRSLTVELRDVDVPLTSASLLPAFERSFSGAEDVDALTQELARAREYGEDGGEVGRRALRVLLLRLAGAKRLRGELEEAELLIDEATELARRDHDEPAIAACKLARSDLLMVRGEFDEAFHLADSAIPALSRAGDDWVLAKAWGRLADVLTTRGKLVEALHIRRKEELPVYERLGDVRSLVIAKTNLAIALLLRRPQLELDASESGNLLAMALRDARRLSLPEAEQIAAVIRQIGGDPDAPPFA